MSHKKSQPLSLRSAEQQCGIGGSVAWHIKIRGGSGYQSITKLHKNSKTPKKKTRGGVLSVEEKRENRRISRGRIMIENINAKIQAFKITANKYRNRRKRFGLRMSLICGIINFENQN
jgi:hypothetical protein